MISAGVEGRLHYMTYPEPWRGPPKQPPEFLRPAPKPLPPASRYNGVNNIVPNGTRLAPQQRPPSKYSSPPAVAPVNLAQHKEDVPEEIPYSPYSRLFTHQPTPFGHFAASPYASLYQSPYTPILRPNFVPPPPLSPLETYSPTTPTPSTASTFLSPPSTFSPPSAVKPGQSVLIRDKRPPPPPPPPSQQQLQQQQQHQQQQQQQQAAFKVPSGKEGSLKHRILTRPEDTNARIPLDLQKPGDAATKVISENPRKRLTATQSPPRSPKKSLNNNTVPGNFAKGSLIQLATGELRRVEDMRTEDFILSADHSPELRLADSTVVRIEENPITGSATITLSYNQRRTQVEIETTLDHPFFVYGQGWASCSPDRTLQCYGLKVHRLQVGDILISLTPREPNAGPPPRTSTIITTATTTAMTVRQVSTGGISHIVPNPPHIGNDQQHNSQCLSPDSLASRKRRWSAPDQICDENEQILRKQHRVE